MRPKKGGEKLAKSQPPGEAGPEAGLDRGRGRGGAAGARSDRWPAKRHTRLFEENGAPPVGGWAEPRVLKRGAEGAGRRRGASQAGTGLQPGCPRGMAGMGGRVSAV